MRRLFKSSQSSSRARGLSPSRRGAALIIILAFIVLLTVLVVAYFSFSALQRQISQSVANQAAVKIFAQGAANTIVSDLKQEIAAGSTNYTFGTNQVYFPLSVTNAVPARVGTADSLPNLVKRSASGLAFYPGGTSRAAALSSTNASQNGRSLSSARWNAALLLPKADTNSTTSLAPISAFTAPDWILVARDGSNPTAWSTSLRWNPTNSATVVGRYAYAIYDEGGLLDANVAGFPPGSSTNFTADKGGLALADLTVLPGMTTNAANALIGWRNAATAQPSGAFPAYTFTDAGRTNYLASIRSNISAYLRTANTNLVNGQTDHAFTSRQQLIQFLTQGVASTTTEKASLQNALQYLGTFSRDLEQPSFRPDPNRPKNIRFSPTVDGGNDAYSTDGSLQDKINPALLTVRDSNGLPLVKRRFPLSRLALVKPNPSAADAAKIYDYFGLTWDSANTRWVYNHGGADGQIYSLSDIPNGREPDFFELLRAVIHCDSLGKQHGGLDSNNRTVAGSTTVYSPHEFGGSPAAAGIDGFVNYQILQIGANLIDQYDADSLPTRIYFNFREFYGIENIPYLAGWQQMWYRMVPLTVGTDIDSTNGTPPSSAEGTTYETWVMIQPIIWNPHAPDTDPNPPDVPTDFRVVASDMTDGAIQLHPQVAAAWWTGTDYTHVQSTYPATPSYAGSAMVKKGSLYAFPDATIDPSISILTFNTGSGDAAFREPFRLRAPNFPVGSNSSNIPAYADGTFNVVADPGLIAADGGSSRVIGFFVGRAWTGPSDHTSSKKWLATGNFNRDLKLKLQYKDPASGSWLTYDVIEQVYCTSGNVSTVDNSDTGNTIRGFRTCFRADPRTDRWGLFQMNTFPSISASSVPSGLSVIDNAVDQSQKTPLNYLPQGTTWMPSQNSMYVMTGNNTGGAAANGWSSADWKVGDLMANIQNSNSNPNIGTKTTSKPGAKTYYTDPDGVFRRGSGGDFSGNDGLPLYTGNFNSRPMILNRPFRSIAEMGYAFRGQAWKEIDFSNPESGDSALLDAFCLNELEGAPENVTVAGRLDLNTRQSPVLQALLAGTSKAEGGTLTTTEIQNAAQALINWTTDTTTATAGIPSRGPLRNRSELVGKFVSPVSVTPTVGLTGSQTPILEPTKTYSGFSSMLTSGSGGVFAASSDAAIKRRRESVIRALADCGNTRTWNLLIDLVAQVGRYPASATSLGNFNVEAETRLWIHLALDRSTGQVVACQIEPVAE